LDRLKQELRRVALEAPAKDALRHFRLPIDRSFAVKGFGTVVTGTLISGTVHVEDEAELLPGRRRVRVRGIQSGGHSVLQAVAGQRTALNLAGLEHSDVHRGMVLAPPGLLEPTRRFEARVTLLPSARALPRRSKVHLHQGAAEAVAELTLLDTDELAPGDSAFAQLRPAQPLVVLPGDRFILRRFSPVITIGGGVVLLNAAPRRRRMENPECLRALENGDRGQVLAALLQADPRGVDLSWILARTGWLKAEAIQVARQLAATGRAYLVPGLVPGQAADDLLVVAAEHRAALLDRIRREVDAFHRANSLAEGISKEELRTRLKRRAGAALFRAALEALAAAGELLVAGDTIKRAGRELALSPEEARAREQIERAFSSAGLAVPALKDVLAQAGIEPKRAQKILLILLREKLLVKVTEDLVFHQSALAQLLLLLSGYKKKNGETLSVAAFKDLTGISRKYAIPLLEYLDRQRVTRRVGDARVILS
jgi:selenocysteine-specific elongation factor